MRALRRYGRGFLLCGFLLAWSHSALSEDKTVSWDAPTEYEDGTPLTTSDLTQYDLTCTGVSAVFPGDVTSAIQDFPPGDYTCTLTVTATNGLESQPSNAVSFTVARPPSPPKAPMILIVTP